LSNRRRLLAISDARPTEHVTQCLLGIASLVMMGCGVLADSPAMAGMGAILAGLLVLSRLAVDLRSGVTSSNWGTWRRNDHRVGFLCNVCFWSVITILWFAVGIVAMLGFIQVSST
jgi:hypothetical protein